jgi:hypothetical protein
MPAIEIFSKMLRVYSRLGCKNSRLRRILCGGDEAIHDIESRHQNAWTDISLEDWSRPVPSLHLQSQAPFVAGCGLGRLLAVKRFASRSRLKHDHVAEHAHLHLPTLDPDD